MSQHTWGAGSLHERKDRKGTWRIQLTNPATGKRQTRDFKAKGRRDAEKQAAQIVQEMNARAMRGLPSTDRKVTLATYIEEWLAAPRSEYGRVGNTIGTYQGHLRNTWVPKIGNLQLGEITVLHVEQVLHEAQAERNLAENTVKNIKSALSTVLNDAKRARLVTFNACEGARLPRNAPAAKHGSMPTMAEVRHLLEVGEGTEIGRILWVMAATGLRVGEVLGLYWSDIDLDGGAITIERTTSRDRTGKAIMGSRTKNKKVRTLPLQPWAVKVLREQRVYVLERKMVASHWSDNDLVFPTKVGTVSDQANQRRFLNRLIAKTEQAHAQDPSKPAYRAGSFHSLRHFFSGIGLANAEAAQVQQLLGHTTLRMTTGTYGHLVNQTAVEVSEAVSRALGMDAG